MPVLEDLSLVFSMGAQAGCPTEAGGAGGWDAAWDLEGGKGGLRLLLAP